MEILIADEFAHVQQAIDGYIDALSGAGMTLHVRHNFGKYAAIRRVHGDTHLNQAFDPAVTRFGPDDFWLLAENHKGEAIATYCLRRFVVDDFYDLIRSQTLWFPNRPCLVDPRFVVECRIPPFGGEVSHGGGLWIRKDYRGSSRLALIMPRFARAVALRLRPFDHDSAMIRNDAGDRANLAERKATFVGRRVYGFARVHRFVDGWFPPERREAIMHLCHATRVEAVASLIMPPPISAESLRRIQLGKGPLVDQNNKLVHMPAILGQGQQQAGV